MSSSSLYNTDFFEWTQETAGKIRDRRFDDIELSALARRLKIWESVTGSK